MATGLIGSAARSSTASSSLDPAARGARRPDEVFIDQGCRMGCRHCGRRMGVFFKFNGFGINRRKHERSCLQSQLLTLGYARCNYDAMSFSSSSACPETPGLTSAASTLVPDGPGGATSSPLAVLATALEVQAEVKEVVRLVQAGHVSQALDVGRTTRLLERPVAQGDPVELQWLRDLAPRHEVMQARLQVPPAGLGWVGPYEHVDGEDVQLQLWYKWTGVDTLTTMSRTTLRGTLEQGLALLHEADLEHNWLPCLTKGDTDWSTKLPALVVDLHAKIPVIPKLLSTVVHRTFVDHHGDNGRPGFAILDWTPSEHHVADGHYCGMRVPTVPKGTTRIGGVKLAATLLQQVDREKFSMLLCVEQQFSRRLAPDFVVRPFFKLNSRICAQRMLACIKEFDDRGYAERVREDRQGIYRRARRLVGRADRGR